MIARDGELPAGLSRTEWKQATGGLLLTAALVVLVTLGVRSVGHRHDGERRVSAGLCGGERRPFARAQADRRQRGRSCGCRCVTCLAMFAMLAQYTYQQQPAAIAAW